MLPLSMSYWWQDFLRGLHFFHHRSECGGEAHQGGWWQVFPISFDYDLSALIPVEVFHLSVDLVIQHFLQLGRGIWLSKADINNALKPFPISTAFGYGMVNGVNVISPSG